MPPLLVLLQEDQVAYLQQKIGFDLVRCPNGHEAGRFVIPTRRNPNKEVVACKVCRRSWFASEAALAQPLDSRPSDEEFEANMKKILDKMEQDEKAKQTVPPSEAEEKLPWEM